MTLGQHLAQERQHRGLGKMEHHGADEENEQRPVLVIADLTRGTGRFNLTLGAIATAVGIGASLSQVIAGSIVHHFGSSAGFLFLAAVAAAAFGILYFFMPETRDKLFLNPTQGATL
ncbi:MAG: hypothetical protein ABSE42_17175 [Bryobacteraceae bacterium]|jgi:MFS family permease